MTSNVSDLVRVKPLEWDDFEGQGAKSQITYSLSYLITKWSTGKFELAVSCPGHEGTFDGPRFYDTLNTAKSAAQADYEARIYAALEPADKPNVFEVAQHLHDIINCGNCSGSRHSARLALRALAAQTGEEG